MIKRLSSVVMDLQKNGNRAGLKTGKIDRVYLRLLKILLTYRGPLDSLSGDGMEGMMAKGHLGHREKWTSHFR